MPIIVKDSGGSFTPAPEGLHQAVCCDVIDLGMVETNYKGHTKLQPKVVLSWLIEDINPENGKHFMVSQRYTASLSEKANLRKLLETWRGRRFTPEELAGFDLETVIGANCLLQIMHNQSGDKTYANVQGIVPLPKNTPKMAVPGDYIRFKDREQHPAESGDADDDRAPRADPGDVDDTAF